jgi:uncharacterized membrane protein
VKLPSKSEAQKRADQVRAFERELAHLEQAQVVQLGAEDHAAIRSYHQDLLKQYTEQLDIDTSQGARQLSLGMRIASFLGALALAASVFFLFYQFWGLLGTTTQVLILILAPLATFVATLAVAAREKTGYFAKLLGLVSFACFVLNLSMLGQIFNITPTDNALVVWAALALLIAYACDVRLLLAAGILCVIAFISARTGTWSGIYWIHFGERPENFFPAAILIFLVPQFISHQRFWGFEAIYRVFGMLCAFIPLLILSNWSGGSYLDWDADVVEGFYQFVGFALSAAMIWLGIKQHWPHVTNTGNVFFVIFIYTKLFDWWWDVMPKYLFFLLLALMAILILFVFKRLRGLTTQSEATT